MDRKPYMRVLGSADWQPSKDNDSSCYLLNDELLIDTGWGAALTMINHGLDPISVKTVCFTHMHADHYMGLTHLILYWRIREGSLGDLTILGPKQTVEESFYRAFDYVFHDAKDTRAEVRRMPKIVPLSGGDVFSAAGFDARVTDADHAVPGLCYRFTHRGSKHSIGFTGDTRYRPELAGFFMDCDLLVHEASFGGGPLDPVINDRCRHSSALEAAQTAEVAHVKNLLLSHAYESKREAALAAARKRLNIPVEWAMPLHTYAF